MFTISNPENYDAARYLISDMMRDLVKRVGGTTQKDQAREEGIRLGKIEGCLEGLAVVLNERRAARYSDMKMMPILIGSDLNKLYKAWAHRWKVDHSIVDRAERSKAENSFWEDIGKDLDLMAFDSKLEEQRLDERKRAILAKEIEPDDSDKEWIAEMVEKSRTQFEELNAILNK